MRHPIHVISLGAGVQSSTMALMAAAGEIGPMPDGAIFADTQGEPKSVYSWLDWLEKQLPFPVYRVTQGSLEQSSLAMHTTKDGRKFSKTDIPFYTLSAENQLGKIVQRGCTRDFKLKPLISKQRQLVAAAMAAWRKKHQLSLKAISNAKKDKAMVPMREWNEAQVDALVISWIGISLDEASRMKQSRDVWVRSRWPLIELRLKRSDCLQWMKSRGFPKPPRSACVYCPFHNGAEWRRLKNEEPTEFAKAVQFERDIQSAKKQSANFSSTPFLHRSCVPLDQVDFSTEEERGQLNMFNNECEGMCGV